mgnify:CR=1 FL=1
MMNVPTMAELVAKGESPEILFWVGCAGSFDPGNAESSANPWDRLDRDPPRRPFVLSNSAATDLAPFEAELRSTFGAALAETPARARTGTNGQFVMPNVTIGRYQLLAARGLLLRDSPIAQQVLIGVIIIALTRNFLNLARIEVFWQGFATGTTSPRTRSGSRPQTTPTPTVLRIPRCQADGVSWALRSVASFSALLIVSSEQSSWSASLP